MKIHIPNRIKIGLIFSGIMLLICEITYITLYNYISFCGHRLFILCGIFSCIALYQLVYYIFQIFKPKIHIIFSIISFIFSFAGNMICLYYISKDINPQCNSIEGILIMYIVGFLYTMFCYWQAIIDFFETRKTNRNIQLHL
jgi:hypothetical protein